MRAFDRTLPEERNRVLTDQLSQLLLCSTRSASEQLAREGAPGQAVVVGDVMVDVAYATRERALARTQTLERLHLQPGGYVLVTAHRAANVDDPPRWSASWRCSRPSEETLSCRYIPAPLSGWNATTFMPGRRKPPH